MKVILTFYSGEEREFHTDHRIFTIGRSAKADITLAEEGISRIHCEIDVNESGETYVTDMGSTNGVQIDGKKIKPHTKTLYNSFLSLSLGPIQSLQIMHEEIFTKSPPSIERTPVASNFKKSKPLKTEPKPKKVDQKTQKHERNTESNYKLLILLIGTFLIMGSLYFYYQNRVIEADGLPLPLRKIEF